MDNNGKSYERLRAVSLFRQLPEDVLLNLGGLASEEHYERNDILFNEGEAGDALFLVVEGTVLIQKVLSKEEGTYKDLGVAEAGEIFGEMALFDNMPRSATVRATSTLTVLRIGRKEFDRFLQEDPESARVILGGIINILSSRLRETAQHTATLYEVGNSIASISDMGELSRRVNERLEGAIFHVRGTAFCLWNPYMDECDVLYEDDLVPGTSHLLAVSKTGPMAGFLKYNRTPFIMKGLDEDHPLRTVFGLGDRDSLLVGPLMQREDVLGYIILAGRGEPFTSFHRILLSAVCTQVATAVVNFTYAQDAAARDRLNEARGLSGLRRI